MKEKKTDKVKIGDKEITISTGNIAGQADGAVIAELGGTVVLATVVSSKLKEDIGYFPLHVEYRERLSAGGRIKGSRWVKREGRPTDDEILTSRLIDRSIRPLFPKDYKKEVQVLISVLSIDQENPPDMVASIAVATALSISSIPWKGPIAILRTSRVEGELKINPTVQEIEAADMDLIVSIADESVVMIEAGANQVTEEDLLDGIKEVEKAAKKVNKFITDFAKKNGATKEKVEKPKTDSDLMKHVKKEAGDKVKEFMKGLADKSVDISELNEFKDALKESVEEEKAGKVGDVFEDLLSKEVRKTILSGKRPDGRKHDELRELSAEVEILPRTHGSAIFNRGNTQALTVATLGAPSLEQTIETAEGEETKRYIHHYNMPPYSVGETGRVGYPSRREVGHGALAEKALLPIIPDEDEFPYTIYVLTEILSSNGSTSMASVCGSTLSLMDAGVPIKNPIAGIAMGIVVEDEKNYSVLTDIVGLEDYNGDMDFKVAGSKDGVTAMQLDVKTLSLKTNMLEKALEQAKKARLEILEVMAKAIDKPRDGVSEYAPKIKVLNIDPSKIGELIGPGGKTIKKIIAETEAQIDVDDDGTVFVSATAKDSLEKAVEQVEAITKDPEPGEIYEGEVKRVQPFGAFVEILPGKEGLVHISDISEEYVKDPNDFVSLGDTVQVRVKEIDDLGRLNLSMILDASKDKSKGGGGKGGNGRDRGQRQRRGSGRSDSRKGKGDWKKNDRNKKRYSGKSDKGKKGGPHFPASRLMEDKDKKY